MCVRSKTPQGGRREKRAFLSVVSGSHGWSRGQLGRHAAQSAPPTFYKDVLPILQNNCQTCHRPGEVAPMSLHFLRRGAAVGAVDQDRRPWRQQMPPWFADPDYGLFSNERKLSSKRDRDAVGVGRRRRAGGQPERRAAREALRRRLEHQARRHRRDAEAVRASGDRHHQLQVHRRPHELQRRHVGRGRRDAAGQRGGAASRQGVGASAGLVVDEGRRSRARRTRTKRSATSSAELARKKATTSSASSTPASGRSASIRKARRSSCRRDRISSTRCTTRRTASRQSDVSKIGLVLAKDDPAKRYLLPRRSDGEQPRDSCRRRQRRSRERSDARRAGPARLRAAAHAPARQGFRAAGRSRRPARRRPCSRASSISSGRWAISSPKPMQLPRGHASSGSSRTSTTRRPTASIRIRRRRSCGVPRTGTR